MKNKNLLIFIGLLALIAILLTIWMFMPKPIKKSPPLPSQPSPPSLPSFPSYPSLPEKVKEEVIDSLPHETEGYLIQYLPNTDKFFILIKKNPYQQYKNQAVIWFRGFGVANPEEDLPLFFTSTRWIAPE